MKLYLKIYFSSEGASTMEIIKRAEKEGFGPTVGDYDFVIDIDSPEEYTDVTEKIHKMLKGTKCMYKVTTHR
jgi:hypothetical protein